jgi:predicted nucleotidyltransferase
MKNLYNIKFSDLNENLDFKDMFLALESSLKSIGINFYLIGAIAKNVWMTGIHKQGPSKATKDFDIAILIATKKEFQSLKEHLVNVNKFEASSENAFTIVWKGKYVIDLMPFGEIENEEGRVIVDGKGFVNISVPGFYDIYKNELTTLNVENVTSFNICSLIDIVILKLFAWSDRPELREKDVTDIGEILYNYFEMYDEYIYENYAYLFDKFNSEDLKLLAAYVVGVEIKIVLRNNNSLLEKIINIVESDIILDSKSRLAIIMTRYFDTNIDFNIDIFKNLLSGIKNA